jgi:hypothetical protein
MLPGWVVCCLRNDCYYCVYLGAVPCALGGGAVVWSCGECCGVVLWCGILLHCVVLCVVVECGECFVL